MKIDSHHHLWTMARGDYNWLTPAMGAIYRDFTPADFFPHLRDAGIDRTIVVQAADTIAETEFLLSHADKTSWIAGVVGWVDMESPTAIADLERLSQVSLFKGIRPMIQDIEDDDWILRPRLDPVFDALAEMGLTFDALVLPRHLPRLLKRLQKHPDLKCVIDHGAKPELASGNLRDWKTSMSDLADNTGCLCKFSGLVTEAGTDCSIETVRPAAEHILDGFGANRVMFGSDWPVLNLASDYAGWITMAQEFAGQLDGQGAARFWGKTAAGFYSVDP